MDAGGIGFEFEVADFKFGIFVVFDIFSNFLLLGGG